MRRTEVKERLRQLIERRLPGEVLPSERALSTEIGVSRPTLRAAIDELERDGLVVREHGRGTFTAPRKISQDLVPATGREQYAPPADGDWSSRVIDFATTPAGARLGKRLEVSPGRQLVAVTRIRVVEEAPMAIERILVPRDLVPDITAAGFESGSFYELLRTRYEVVPATAVQVIEPTVTDTDESTLLGVPLHSPALLFERTTRDADGRVIEYTRSIYRGDRYRITSHLKFDHTSG
ncbi:GntR family transcriptional regulator [Amycolatopsis thailandensis]|uniref:GntR family transcriptional regulator n=1 Tax=Amycolatopsis thailandensis TaxID=589330 RepID=UPI00363A6F3D